MATPRDMDPKFKDEETVETTTEVDTVKDVRESEDTPMIVYRQPATDDKGQATMIQHGPMPVSEWSDYERENKL